MKKIRVKLRDSYDIIIGAGLLRQAGRLLKEAGLSGKAVIVTDSIVGDIYGNTLRDSLTANGFEANVLTIPAGEEQKSLDTAGKLYHQLGELHTERGTPVLALGGGVIGDLAGFVAATYMRGVPLVQVPTTLLAQVDSSIGGKVAINHGYLKNNIGGFYQPLMVISDVDTLRSLPTRQISEGLAETIKYGIISDIKLFQFLEQQIAQVRSLEGSVLEEALYRSAEIKAGVVEKDERDTGLRNILNYGHTAGHGIESASDFRIGHGEAVAIGMIAAARISNSMGILDKEASKRMEELIRQAGLPTRIPSLKIDNILQSMKHDKKIQSGKFKFILARAIGEVYITDEVSPQLVEEVLVKLNE
ncbi:3-dehydroquinate synthase [Chloroflexota bacterium]